MMDTAPRSQAAPDQNRIAVIIPARFESTRFPGKPLAPLRGADGTARSLIVRTWEAAQRAAGVSEVWVATDDPRIAEAADAAGARVILTPVTCRNGTERCWHAVAAAGIRADIIINLQGDAPLVPPEAIEALAEAMQADPRLAVTTPMIRCAPLVRARLQAEEQMGRVGATTVVFDARHNALYFSKRVLPYLPDGAAEAPVYLHLGLYGYRREALQAYAAAPPSPLEALEGLEQLRFLHAGIPIRLIEISEPDGGLWEVNNPTDVAVVEAALAARGLS